MDNSQATKEKKEKTEFLAISFPVSKLHHFLPVSRVLQILEFHQTLTSREGKLLNSSSFSRSRDLLRFYNRRWQQKERISIFLPHSVISNQPSLFGCREIYFQLCFSSLFLLLRYTCVFFFCISEELL